MSNGVCWHLFKPVLNKVKNGARPSEKRKSICLNLKMKKKRCKEKLCYHARIVSEFERAHKRRILELLLEIPFLIKEEQENEERDSLELVGFNEGTGNILGVPDESTVVSRASSEGTGSKPGVPDEEKLILEWEADVVNEHFDRDDNAGDDNEGITKLDPEEIISKDEPGKKTTMEP
ncbi:hypothetical protein Tco_0840914 [Tanacetum coccineum]|uniref:Uncharacterized protein n=1 Tax=Tanacetum coccineum TaxID=301880 RepID=A0ABQ5AXA0_9ASTR